MKSRTFHQTIVVTLLAGLAFSVRMGARELADEEQHANHHRYKLIDIGTFGGPDSYFTFGVGLNNRGVAAGAAATSAPDPFNPICIFPDCFVGHAFRWQDGVLTDLGALPGTNNSGVGGMNAHGTVAGVSENGLVDPVINFPDLEPVVWKNGQLIDLGTFGGNFGQANAINDRGQVAGFATNTISTPVSIAAFGCDVDLAVPTQSRAFIWEGGAIQDLGTLGGTDSCAVLINQRGQVAGYSYTSSTPNPGTGIPTFDPFLWEKNHGMLDLGTLGGTQGVAGALNNRGQVVGQSNLTGDLTCHPFLWEKSRGMEDLGTLGGDGGTATSLNEAGEVVGKADLPGASGPCDGPEAHHAFRWRHGVMTDLGTQDGDPCSEALSINGRGQIVGASTDCSTFLHAFLWEEGGPMIDLNSFVPASSDLTLTVATLINERGEIAVQGVLPDGDTHAVLLVPCESDQSDDHSCEDAKPVMPSRNHAAPPTAGRPSTMTSSDPKASVRPGTMLERFRARWAGRYHIPLPGAPRN